MAMPIDTHQGSPPIFGAVVSNPGPLEDPFRSQKGGRSGTRPPSATSPPADGMTDFRTLC